MRSFQRFGATALCCLVIGLCVLVAGVQVRQTVRRFIGWQRRQEPIPAFGAADVVYFYEPTCPACEIASPTILKLRRQYPRYRIARVDTSAAAGIALEEEYSAAYRVPARDRGHIPIAFAGRRYFLGWPAIQRDLTAYLRRAPIERPRPVSRPRETGSVILARRFESFGAAPVILAGLVDSINPCAVATLIFFLSYLTLGTARGGGRPREMLWICGLFTLGVFVTYTLIGFGLLRALHSLQGIPVLARALYPVATLVTLGLAAVSLLDYRRARRGETAQIALQLPRSLKRRIHQVIRTQIGVRHLAGVAFGTAVVVSALEFTCTSQVYLPTLMYIVQAGHERFRATLLLLLYNLAFVLPFIVLFVAAYLGVSTRALSRLAARHTATAKLAMSLLFAGFTIYLFSVSLRMFHAG